MIFLDLNWNEITRLTIQSTELDFNPAWAIQHDDVSVYLVVVKSKDCLEEWVSVCVALVDQGQVELDQNLLDVET